MISHVSLYNYRNLNTQVPISDLGNVLIDTNGAGKSNFLESIYLSISGTPYRDFSTIAETVGPSDTFARVQLTFDNTQLQIVTQSSPQTTRRFSVNGKQRIWSTLIGKFPGILFAPQSVDIVNSEPSLRRRDLDQFLSIVDKDYATNIQKYQKLLRNRNAVLKNVRENKSNITELDYWTQELLLTGIKIFQSRIDFFEHIKPYMSNIWMELISGLQNPFTIIYKPHSDLEIDTYVTRLQQKYVDNQNKEIAAGQTLYGPHKDDYILMIGDKNLRYFGSRGQQRLGALIWKLAQRDYTQNISDHHVLLLLDDIMSELDSVHRTLVGDFLLNNELQFILTGADENDIPVELLRRAKRLKLR